MLLRSVRPGRYRLGNDGGGPSEPALRPGVSRSSVRFPNARPSAPEKKPRRRRQRGARPDGLAAIGLGSACQLRPRRTTPTRALRRWRIAPLPRPPRGVPLSVPAATPQQRRLLFVGSWTSLPIPLHAKLRGAEGRRGAVARTSGCPFARLFADVCFPRSRGRLRRGEIRSDSARPAAPPLCCAAIGLCPACREACR